VADLKRAQALLDRLSSRNWAKTLNRNTERANPLLPVLGLVGRLGYYWSFRQSGVATDVMLGKRIGWGAETESLLRPA